MQVVLTKKEREILQKNLKFTEHQKSGVRSDESLKNEIVQKLFELVYKAYGRTTDKHRIAYGIVVTQKENKVHLSDKAWAYLLKNKYALAKEYIGYCKKFHRYE